MAVITLKYGNRHRLIGLPASVDELLEMMGSFTNVPDPCHADFKIYMRYSSRLRSEDEEVELDLSAFEAIEDGSEIRIELY